MRKLSNFSFPNGFHLKFFRIIADRCGSVVVREREIGTRTARRGPKRCEQKKKKKNSEGVGTIFRQKMNRMIKLTKIEIVLRLRFLFHGTCMTDGTCK